MIDHADSRVAEVINIIPLGPVPPPPTPYPHPKPHTHTPSSPSSITHIPFSFSYGRLTSGLHHWVGPSRRRAQHTLYESLPCPCWGAGWLTRGLPKGPEIEITPRPPPPPPHTHTHPQPIVTMQGNPFRVSPTFISVQAATATSLRTDDAGRPRQTHAHFSLILYVYVLVRVYTKELCCLQPFPTTDALSWTCESLVKTFAYGNADISSRRKPLGRPELSY